ncbi:oxidoreductase [Heyndrickxia shackletonii]|uniref:Oxidoreductase n=1 Tax=Heyndrickxia shackletonii TaxID=157838 RepID=A0A0Q3TFH6_9BACI|nr:SDR family NAD(P)-dependent oxidoreductase [Heyndrickxia shackletonii]KQL52798.1 oxidoreductase [Heyndrickxia shackletonii]NEZ00067.1 SDR family oxidoreductase [Heyndrickxia shackletonii]
MYCMDLTGKVAIVTGGAQGIGKAIVDALLDCGAKVAAIDINVDPQQTTNHLLYLQANVAKSEQVEEMVQTVTKTFGRVDILVNNAGVSSLDYAVDIKASDWDRVMDVNAKGVYLCSQAVARYLKEQGEGGKIINISSQAGKNGYRLMGSYVASKHAVLGFTKVMAIELAKDQINVNAVCPGIVETDMKRNERVIGGKLRGLNAEAIKDEDISQVPLGRTATPQDIANVVVFLASKYSDYMTGQGINVTGGMTMH